MARVNINQTRSRVYANGWAEDHLVDPLSRKILMAAKREAPVLTGALRLSLHVEKQIVGFNVTHWVGSRVNHAYLIQSGARPHMIFPRKRGGRLTFYWKKVGRVVNLPYVHHPGFKRVNYLQRPLVEYATAARFKVITYPIVR